MEKDVNICFIWLEYLTCRHVRYEDGDLPVIVDVSCRERESEINPKVDSCSILDCRIRQFSKLEFVVISVDPMKQWENANMVRTVYTVMKLWICVVFFICISMITLVAALDLCRNENDLKIPSYYNAR